MHQQSREPGSKLCLPASGGSCRGHYIPVHSLREPTFIFLMSVMLSVPSPLTATKQASFPYNAAVMTDLTSSLM